MSMEGSYSSNGGSSSGDDEKQCRRGHWRPAEDVKLQKLVKQFGPRNWNSIAEKIEGRTGKSCRLRWYNQLDPRINKRPFSEEEEERLLSSHRKFGNKWSLIARLFPGRTDNAVKNHYHVIIARRKREGVPIVDQSKNGSINTMFTMDNISQQKYSKPSFEFGLQNPIIRGDIFSSSSSSKEFKWPFDRLKKLSNFDSSCFGIKDFMNSSFFEEGHNKQNFGATFKSCNTRSFEFSNLGIGYYGSDRRNNNRFVRFDDDNSMSNLKSRSSGIQGEQARDESTKHRDDDVPFIDFLGVGVSS